MLEAGGQIAGSPHHKNPGLHYLRFSELCPHSREEDGIDRVETQDWENGKG